MQDSGIILMMINKLVVLDTLRVTFEFDGPDAEAVDYRDYH